MKTAFNCILFAVFLIMASCSNNSDKSSNDQSKTLFINPAFENFDIPFEEYSILTEKGDTIFTKAGSIILFPPDAFTDINGNLITGKVKVTYRELSDPIDFFISGIPMNYDSANTKYTFESAGMIEIYAFKDNTPVYVNPKNKPEVNLVSNNKNGNFNLYYLDTIQKKWINKGKDMLTDLSVESSMINVNADNQQIQLTPPVKPEKASGKRPTFTIIIEPGSVPELQIYHNLKFEVAEEEKNFKASDANIAWDDVKLEKKGNSGTYIVTFTKKKYNVSYLVRPVFEGKNYDDAMKIFEEKNREYQKLMEARVVKQKTYRDSIQAEIDRRKEMIALMEKKRKEEEKVAFEQGGATMKNEIFRTFSISGFGAWNCDRPILQQGIQIAAKFKDIQGNEISLGTITVVVKGINSYFQFYSPNITLLPNAESMIWSVVDDKFIYLSFDDYMKCNIDANTKNYNFTMRIYPDIIKSREDFKKIVGL